MSIHNFTWRGYRMRSEKLSQGKDFDFRWAIFFDHPKLLTCRTQENELIDSFNLEKHDYFDLSEDQQNKLLFDFIQTCLERF